MRHMMIAKRWHFESAHFLPLVPDGHRCKRMHGHNYEIEITMSGPLDRQGFVMDFWDMDKLMEPLLKEVDHQTLNDIQGLENPTAENITSWFFDRLQKMIDEHPSLGPLQIISVTVWETKDCRAVLTASVPTEQLRHIMEEESPA